MKPLRLVLAALLLPLLATAASAEDWALARLTSEALRTHPLLEARRQGEMGAAADVEGAKWQRFPVPGVQASQDTKGKNALVFSLQQPLWTGGRISAAVDAAEARQLAAKETTRTTRQELLSQVAGAYVEAALRQRQRITLDKSLAQHENLLGMISRRVEHQFSPQADRELAQSRLRAAQNEKSSVIQALDIALAQLSELAGSEVSAVSGDKGQVLDNLPESKEAAQEQARKHSPYLAQLERQAKAAEADVASKRSAFWPALAARVESAAGSNPDNRAMMVVESQFGAGLSAQSGVESAQAAQRGIVLQRVAAERELRTQVAQQWSTFVEARRRHANAEQTSRSSWSVYESYVRLYTISQKSWLDVLNQLREAVSADLSEESALAEVHRSALLLGLLTGRLDPVNGPESGRKGAD